MVIRIDTWRRRGLGLLLGHEDRPRITGSVVPAGTSGVAWLVERRGAAGTNGTAGSGFAATGRRQSHPPSGQQCWVDAEDGVAGEPALSARGLGAGFVRWSATRKPALAGCSAAAADHCLGLQ